MKILFINPSLRLETPNKYLPVGLGAVMTYVDRLGDYQIELLDIDINACGDDAVEKIIYLQPGCFLKIVASNSSAS
jgi:hypothetical protein